VSGAEITPSESLIDAGIKPNRFVGSVGNVGENSMTISQSQSEESTEDKIIAGKFSRLERDIIEVIKNPPIGRRVYKFELISFLEQREYKEKDIEKALDKLVKEGIVILYPDERLEINFSRFGGV